MVNIRKPKTALKFKKPASWWGSTWREAVPAGNSKIGIAVYGGAGTDNILINHSDLWWQGYVGTMPDVADKIKDVKKALESNSPKEAENILSNALISKAFRPQMAYPLPLCCLKVSQPLEKPVKDYMRVLNMDNGEISVSFRDGSTKYDRSVFVSRTQDMICYEITRSGGKAVEVEFSLAQHEKFNARTANGISKTPESVAVKCENYFIYYAARSDNGTDFGAVAKIQYYGGTMEVKKESIAIKGAERVYVLIKPFVESQRDKEWKAIKAELTAVKLTYEKLLKEHTTAHQRLFGSADISFGADKHDMFVEDLLDDAISTGEVSLALLEKLWAYGRYLMVSGTSESSRPLAPYGLWCGDYKAQDCFINAAGSVQMLYSHALQGGLMQNLLPLFDSYISMTDDLKKNASRLFSCRGIMVPAVMAPTSGFCGLVEPSNIHFTGAAGWICQLMYDYYLYTDDKKFLKDRALPFMKETATFYEEFIKSVNGIYETSPSYSPYTTPANYSLDGAETLGIARNATIDFAIVKELLKNLISVCGILGVYKDEIAKWQDMLTRIPAYQLNSDNTVREYIDPRYQDNPLSAGTAHFYPVYPGTEIGRDNAEFAKAYLSTAKKKLSSAVKSQTALTLSTYAAVFARLGEGGAALDTLGTLIRTGLMNNLISVQNDWRGTGVGNGNIWTSYTLEGNMGITSVIQEMLLASTQDTITLLPALPDGFDKGGFSGLNTKCGVCVDAEWDFKKGSLTVKLKSRKAEKITLKLPAGIKKYKGPGVLEQENNALSGIPLAANKVLQLDFKY